MDHFFALFNIKFLDMKISWFQTFPTKSTPWYCGRNMFLSIQCFVFCWQWHVVTCHATLVYILDKCGGAEWVRYSNGRISQKY